MLGRKQGARGKVDGGIGGFEETGHTRPAGTVQGRRALKRFHGLAVTDVAHAEPVAQPVLGLPADEGPGGFHLRVPFVAQAQVGLLLHRPAVAPFGEAVHHGAVGPGHARPGGRRGQGQTIEHPVGRQSVRPRGSGLGGDGHGGAQNRKGGNKDAEDGAATVVHEGRPLGLPTTTRPYARRSRPVHRRPPGECPASGPEAVATAGLPATRQKFTPPARFSYAESRLTL